MRRTIIMPSKPPEPKQEKPQTITLAERAKIQEIYKDAELKPVRATMACLKRLRTVRYD